MTPEQAIAKFNESIKKMRDAKPYIELFNEVKTQLSERIFVQNKNATGGPIGEYSKKGIYVNPLNAPRSFSTAGKSGKTKFENGKPHKTRYFTDYGQFKTTIGEGSKVNLRLFRNFERGFNTGDNLKIEGDIIKYTIGIQNSIANPEGKVESIQERYPDTFKNSAEEKEFIIKELKVIAINSIFGR
jgi:hypothetical protein